MILRRLPAVRTLRPREALERQALTIPFPVIEVDRVHDAGIDRQTGLSNRTSTGAHRDGARSPVECPTPFETFGKAKRAGSEIMTGSEIGAPIGARPDVGEIRERVEWLS